MTDPESTPEPTMDVTDQLVGGAPLAPGLQTPDEPTPEVDRLVDRLPHLELQRRTGATLDPHVRPIIEQVDVASLLEDAGRAGESLVELR